MSIRNAVLFIVLVTATNAWAYRAEFIAQFEGRRITGAEVCFFPAGDSQDDPFDLYLHGEEVRCLSADQVIEIPAGRWLYYLKHAEHLVSSSPSVITWRAPPVPHDLFDTIEVNLRPAGTLDLTKLNRALGPDDSLAVYISNEKTDLLPMLIPIARGETAAMVPASMRLLILQRRHIRITAVSDPIVLKRGEKRIVEGLRAESASRGSVLAWVTFHEEARQPGSHWKKLPAPDVTLATPSGNVKPAIPPQPGFGSDGSLMLFRDVSPGESVLKIGGGVWKPDELQVTAMSRELVVALRPLVTRPGASIFLRWNVVGEPPVDRVTTCSGTAEKPSAASPGARLYTCAGLQPGMTADLLNPSRCNVAASAAISNRSANFEGVAPGNYVLTLSLPPYPVQRQAVSVDIGDTPALDLTVEAFSVFGRVMLDGKPLEVQIEFATGKTTSDASGRYYATLARAPRALPVKIRRCGEERIFHTHIPETPLEGNQPYDIDITSNRIEVTVRDASNGNPIPNAAVQVAALLRADGDAAEFLGGVLPTDEAGKTTAERVQTKKRLSVCAEADKYERVCGESFVFGDRKSIDATISLPFKARHAGKVVWGPPFEWGRVLFVAPNGFVREQSELVADGTFYYKNEHTAPEYIVVVSNFPLLVAPVPSSIEGVLTIAPPATARVRDFEIRVGRNNAQQDAVIGLFIGQRYVPDVALSDHQSARGMQPILYGRGPLRVPAILETGPIQVMLGPSPYDPILANAAGLDFLFTQPVFSTRWPTRTVDAGGRVEF